MRCLVCTPAGRGRLMRVFSKLYDRVMVWSRHRNAPWYLAALSFAESSFFPVPTDVMLAPMVLARPDRAWRLAALAAITSVLGGVAGFLLGALAFDTIEPILESAGYMDAYLRAEGWFLQWGFWAVLAAGFSPIPYKVFTIAAGAMSMAIAPFIAASLVGRAARFFLVAGLVAWGGPRYEAKLKQSIDIIGWVVVVLIVVAYLVLRG